MICVSDEGVPAPYQLPLLSNLSHLSRTVPFIYEQISYLQSHYSRHISIISPLNPVWLLVVMCLIMCIQEYAPWSYNRTQSAAMLCTLPHTFLINPVTTKQGLQGTSWSGPPGQLLIWPWQCLTQWYLCTVLMKIYFIIPPGVNPKKNQDA